MFGLLTMLAAAAAPAPASNGIVYLHCATQQIGGPVDWMLTLNEQAGTVNVVSSANGGTDLGAREATFTPTAVHFLGFTLSRVDMTMARAQGIGDVAYPDETGKCERVQAPARAF